MSCAGHWARFVAIACCVVACKEKVDERPRRDLAAIPITAGSTVAPTDLGSVVLSELTLDLAESLFPLETPPKAGSVPAEFVARRKELSGQGVDLHRSKGRLWVVTFQLASTLTRESYATPMLRLESRTAKLYASASELDRLVAESVRPNRFAPMKPGEKKRVQLVFDLPLTEFPSALVSESAEESNRFSKHSIPIDQVAPTPAAAAVLAKK